MSSMLIITNIPSFTLMCAFIGQNDSIRLFTLLLCLLSIADFYKTFYIKLALNVDNYTQAYVHLYYFE